MTKQYISILELFPKLMGEHTSSIFRLFPLNNHQNHYYEVHDADTPDKKKLTFKLFDKIIETISEEEPRRQGHNRHGSYGSYSTYGKRDAAPYLMEESYEVPHILELEYLKQSTYQPILNNEIINYIENILYQYLLFYDRIAYQDRSGDPQEFYSTYDENSPLYQSIQPFIQTMDSEADDFQEVVNNIVLKNYKDLDKIKRPTKKELKQTTERMYANRNLSELLEMANMRPANYSSEPQTIRRSENISQAIPILMLFSLLAKETKEILYPSYRLYLKEFEHYPRELKMQMREEYTHEQYIEYMVRSGQSRETIENKVHIYMYGNEPRYSSMYIDPHDRRINNFIFPHIMNQVRLAGFESEERMIVPQGLLEEFQDEPWSHLVEPETIVYNRQLDWSEVDEKINITHRDK